jgi:DNA end-binding protein Ku
MARAIWTGSVSFGLVNVPVGLYSATEDHDVHFHQFEKDTTARIRNQRVNERTGEEVPYEDIVKGAEVGDGNYVMLTPEELESVEPGKSRTIEISDFVEAAEIDPVYYQRSYYLAPADKTAVKPYLLLARAMQKAERIGIATFVMRGKQYLAAIRPRDDVLILETMYFADEVRDSARGIDQLPAKATVAPKDLTMAVHLVEALTTSWDPTNYRDTYTARVKKLIDAKEKNREIAVPETTEETEGKVLDLLAALESSVEAAKNHKPGNTSGIPQVRTRKAESSDTEASKKTSASQRSTSQESASKKSSSQKSASKNSAGKKSTAKKSTAKKSTAKKSTTKRSTSRKAS